MTLGSEDLSLLLGHGGDGGNDEAPLRRLVSTSFIISLVSLALVVIASACIVAYICYLQFRGWKITYDTRNRKAHDLRQVIRDDSILPSDWSVVTECTIPQDVNESFFIERAFIPDGTSLCSIQQEGVTKGSSESKRPRPDGSQKDESTARSRAAEDDEAVHVAQSKARSGKGGSTSNQKGWRSMFGGQKSEGHHGARKVPCEDNDVKV